MINCGNEVAHVGAENAGTLVAAGSRDVAAHYELEAAVRKDLDCPDAKQLVEHGPGRHVAAVAPHDLIEGRAIPP